jgi:hypothetical protein
MLLSLHTILPKTSGTTSYLLSINHQDKTCQTRAHTRARTTAPGVVLPCARPTQPTHTHLRTWVLLMVTLIIMGVLPSQGATVTSCQSQSLLQLIKAVWLPIGTRGQARASQRIGEACGKREVVVEPLTIPRKSSWAPQAPTRSVQTTVLEVTGLVMEVLPSVASPSVGLPLQAHVTFLLRVKKVLLLRPHLDGITTSKCQACQILQRQTGGRSHSATQDIALIPA